MSEKNEPNIHPFAVVHPSAVVGAETVVGPFAVIEADVVIGERCRIEAHATIKRFTRMGADNHVFEGAVLGGLPQDLKFSGQDTGLRIEDRNIIREGVTVHRATVPGGDTVIGSDNLLMCYSHVAHDCVLQHHIVMANNTALAGFVYMEEHAFISGGAMVHQFSQVGRYSMTGGISKVCQDVLPFFMVDGIPARTKGLNVVGLRRAGFSPAERNDLKRAYDTLFQSSGSMEEKLEALSAINSEHVHHLIAFIRASKRGFCRSIRRSST